MKKCSVVAVSDWLHRTKGCIFSHQIVLKTIKCGNLWHISDESWAELSWAELSMWTWHCDTASQITVTNKQSEIMIRNKLCRPLHYIPATSPCMSDMGLFKPSKCLKFDFINNFYLLFPLLSALECKICWWRGQLKAFYTTLSILSYYIVC